VNGLGLEAFCRMDWGDLATGQVDCDPIPPEGAQDSLYQNWKRLKLKADVR
jgi:hypothetical protein